MPVSTEIEYESSLAEMKERFFSALLSDVMDDLGYLDQALSPHIRPLDENLVMVGRARTMLWADIYDRTEGSYELEIKLVDSLKRGDIAVSACGKTGRVPPWGGLLSTAAKMLGATGAIMDGLVRDVKHVRSLQFPVYHGGIGPLDSKGRAKVIAIDVPVECGGVRIEVGDLIFGDADGCVVVPKSIEKEVIAQAHKKLLSENNTREALLAGRRLSEVFEEFGTL